MTIDINLPAAFWRRRAQEQAERRHLKRTRAVVVGVAETGIGHYFPVHAIGTAIHVGTKLRSEEGIGHRYCAR